MSIPKLCIYTAFILTVASCVPGCSTLPPFISKGMPTSQPASPVGSHSLSGRYYCDHTPLVCVAIKE